MHCDLQTACRSAHNQDQGDFDALEPWVNGHQIAWDTKAYHLNSLVVSLRTQGVRGGAKSKNLPTRCATILLQQGVPVHKIAQKVDELLGKCDEAEFMTVESEASLARQKQSLIELAAKHKVELYGEVKGKGKGNAKSRRTSKKPMRGAPLVVPSASDFQLEPGAFLFADGTPAAVLTEISTRTTGIALLSAAEAVPWLAQPPSTPDELAVIVLGEGLSCHPQIDKCSIEFPAVAVGTQDRVLLRGSLYQLGSKHVKLGITQLKMVVAETVTCSLTVHSEDFQPESWKSLVLAPAKVILSRLCMGTFFS